MDKKQVARLFHNIYEELAPQFGYETREDTKEFDPKSKNGKLMLEVCDRVAKEIRQQEKAKISKQFLEGKRCPACGENMINK